VHHGFGVYSDSNRNEYRKISGGKAQQACRGIGCMIVGEALLPYRNTTNIFLQISNKIFILQNIT
jgi:hypothetical protein